MAKDNLHWFNYGETLWNERRKASEWHFDPEVKSETKNNVTLLIRKKTDVWRINHNISKFDFLPFVFFQQTNFLIAVVFNPKVT